MSETPSAKARREIGERLRILRAALGEKAMTISEAVGVSPQRWSNWEAGRKLPAAIAMIRFKREFSVSLDYIYDGEKGSLKSDLRAKVDQAESTAAVEAAAKVVRIRAPRGARQKSG